MNGVKIMLRYLSKSLWLLLFSVILICGLYPAAVWVVGQLFFPFQANGSMLTGPNGKPVGSLLIAQPFSKDEYFQPRPSAASYDASASASSAYAPSNYALRNRVAVVRGPIVKYRSGPKAGQLAAPDIEGWFQQDRFQGRPSIVAQWADLHNGVAQAWVGADPSHAPTVDNWAKAHPEIVAKYIKDNPSTPQPKATDLAVVFFENISKEHPGRFFSNVEHKLANGKTSSTLELVKQGTDIQSTFFEMWREEHPDVALQDVPGDLVTASGSGLDPHITLENAEFQLDRVAGKWAANTKREPAVVRQEIEQLLQAKATAPFGGLIGEKLINVLEVNLELRTMYGPPS
jgi:K+-transporting ATPase ATPase C chain